MGECEYSFYVFVTQVLMSLRLLFVGFAALDGGRVDGDIGDLLDASGDTFALVVSTSELT